MSANSSSQGPKTVTAVKTAVFKLHNPTQRKRAMLDRALLHNHLAYTKALKAAMPLGKTFVETELQSRVTDKELTARERNTHARRRKWERAAETVCDWRDADLIEGRSQRARQHHRSNRKLS